ncbi:MAG: substrate-binding domain-containing protein, partial [Armatimonadetes bacterium]|nr:substrate-binding domain-containing protein [Armatimonadota bacterium]
LEQPVATEDGQRAAEQLLSLKKRPDSIFANNDLLAFGAMQVIKKRGLRIPDDIAIVGYSNWFFSALMDPPLSSVHQPGFEMGMEAARLLISQIELKEKGSGEVVPEKKILKTHLVIRESSMRNSFPVIIAAHPVRVGHNRLPTNFVEGNGLR